MLNASPKISLNLLVNTLLLIHVVPFALLVSLVPIVFVSSYLPLYKSFPM